MNFMQKQGMEIENEDWYKVIKADDSEATHKRVNSMHTNVFERKKSLDGDIRLICGDQEVAE